MRERGGECALLQARIAVGSSPPRPPTSLTLFPFPAHPPSPSPADEREVDLCVESGLPPESFIDGGSDVFRMAGQTALLSGPAGVASVKFAAGRGLSPALKPASAPTAAAPGPLELGK